MLKNNYYIIAKGQCTNPIGKYGKIEDTRLNQKFTKKEMKNYDRSTLLLLDAVDSALQDTKSELDSQSTGVVIGNVFGDLESICEFDRKAAFLGPKGVKPSEFTHCVKNGPASNVSIKYGFQALNVTLASGFASSMDAVIYGIDMMEFGYAERIVAGGVEAYSSNLQFGFNRVYPGNEELSEGAGAIVIDKKKPFCADDISLVRIAGYSRACGKKDLHKTIEYTIEKALENGAMNLDDIEMVVDSGCIDRKTMEAEKKALQTKFNNKEVICLHEKYGNVYGANGILAIILASEQLLKPNRTALNNLLINSVSPEGQCAAIILSRV